MVTSLLRVLRCQNLIIVALTMYLMRFGVLQPLLALSGHGLLMSEWVFLLLVLATVFITAGGYVINDYFDTKTDLVNRPQQVVVGKQLSRRSAIFTHGLLSFLGVFMGVVASFYVKRPAFSLAFPVIVGILWFYSTTYKRQLLIGNILVALLTSLVPLMVIVFELPLLYKTYWQEVLINTALFNRPILYVIGFATFAFLLNLFREIVKDIEDFEGDMEYGRNSLPVAFGVKNAQVVAASILLVILLLLAFVFGTFLDGAEVGGRLRIISLAYAAICLVIPIFVLIIKLLMAQKKEHYRSVSRLTKIVMLFGLLYALIIRFFIAS